MRGRWSLDMLDALPMGCTFVAKIGVDRRTAIVDYL